MIRKLTKEQAETYRRQTFLKLEPGMIIDHFLKGMGAITKEIQIIQESDESKITVIPLNDIAVDKLLIFKADLPRKTYKYEQIGTINILTGRK